MNHFFYPTYPPDHMVASFSMGDTMGYPLSLDGSWKIPSINGWFGGSPFFSKPPYVAMLMANAMMNPWFMIGNAMIDGIIHD